MEKCKFCGSDSAKSIIASRRDIYEIDCPLCGYYQITASADACGTPKIQNQKDLILFSGYLRNNSSRQAPIVINTEDLNRIESMIAPYKRLTVLERVNLILKFIGDSSESLGDRININNNDFTRFYCRNDDEMAHICIYLEQTGLLSNTPYPLASLSVSGWQAYQRLKEINIESKKVFVAMSFAPELNPILAAIEEACDACGFKAFRVDSEEHTQKICDKIIADIKESRFIVADFTGQKQGVYFEAGFALGLGLKVIWICKEEDKEKLHFDTRQYNHIFWKDAEDLKKRLIERIKADIK